ncbi:MAG TPA: hypothetical protein PLQ97_14495 [Myxococcota bacterium]|nr:hypothetical protein [Myxococcota bacterium]HQK49901.1 hypothetical protein [Myxococcota bacterium]
MSRFLDHRGFRENPFANYVAENEPNIDEYFVRPPYYTTVRERGFSSKSFILFGARGAGKSATRLALFKQVWNAVERHESAPLTITLDDFSRILVRGLRGVSTREFLFDLGYLVVEAVLVWLSGLNDEERHVCVRALNKDQEKLAVTLVDKFYLSRPQVTRDISATQALKLLNQAWTGRSSLWIQKRWTSIVEVIGQIAKALARTEADVDVPVDESLKAMLAAPQETWNEAHFARALLQRYVEFAQAFGFSGVTVLVDKVDETPLTSNSATSTAQVLFPILANTQLLEVDGFGWSFFLWDRVREQYSNDQFPVRLDKIANAEISWTTIYLQNLVNERLRYFSDKKVVSFAQLCDPTVDSNTALREIVEISMQSPRELIRILDTVVREHDELTTDIEPPPLLSPASIEAALDQYAIDTAKRMYSNSKVVLQQILRLGKNLFTNRDLQVAFKMNPNSARNRISTWTDTGIVTLTGSRPAEGGVGGKPAHEYSVVDQRVRRLIDRTLSLGAEYELDEDEFADESPEGA